MFKLVGRGIEYVLENQNLKDLNPLFFGKEDCLPRHCHGPRIRPYTLIHYVSKGKGVVIKEHGEISVTAGQAFLIHPGEVVTYRADAENPWHYYWIGFDGKLSEKFRELDDVVDIPEHFFESIFMCAEKDMCEYRVLNLLYEIYITLFSKYEVNADYINQVKDYIKAFYMQNISVENIARSINLDRRYLTRIFKQRTGITIQEYIINKRIKASQTYLLQGYSVEKAALMSGYTDISSFSKIFKRKTGISPIQWKKNNRNC